MTTPLHTIDDLIPEHMMRYAQTYEAEIFEDMDKSAIVQRSASRFVEVRKGFELAVIEGGRG